MTCVVGLVENGVVYMGADQATLSDYDAIVRIGFAEAKIIKRDNFLIGYSGNINEGQELRLKLDVSDLVGITTDLRRKELYARFISANPNFTNVYLVAHKKQLYTVWTNCCTTSQYDLIGTDPRKFSSIFSRLKDSGLKNIDLISKTILEASIIPGVACDPEGPDTLSL